MRPGHTLILFFSLILSSLASTAGAGAGAAPEVVATFNGQSGISLVRDTPVSKIRGSHSRSKIDQYGILSTTGASDFHIVYDHEYGYRVLSAEPLKGIGWSAALYPDAVTPFRSGIRIDLQSPLSVLHFDRAELGSNVPFKLLDVSYGSISDPAGLAYLRMVVLSTGEVIPLDWSRVPMARLADSTSESVGNPGLVSQLKASLLQLSVDSSGDVTIESRAGPRVRVKISANSEARVLDAGEWKRYGNLWDAVEQMSQGRVKRTQVVQRRAEVLKDRRSIVWAATNDNSASGFRPARVDDLEVLRPIQNTDAAFKMPSGKIYEDLERVLRDSMMKAGPQPSITVEFQWNATTRQEVTEIFHAYLYKYDVAPVPLREAYFIDQTDSAGSEVFQKIFDDLVELRNQGRPFALVVRRGEKAQISYFYPGSQQSLDEAFMFDDDLRCRARLMHQVRFSLPFSQD